MTKLYHKLLSFFLFLILTGSMTLKAQVTLSASNFYPQEKYSEYDWYGLSEIEEYGVFRGKWEPNLPLTPYPINYPGRRFEFAVVKNPQQLDTAHYRNSFENMAVFQSDRNSSRLMTYYADKLLPNSNVLLTLKIHSVTDPVKLQKDTSVHCQYEFTGIMLSSGNMEQVREEYQIRQGESRTITKLLRADENGVIVIHLRSANPVRSLCSPVGISSYEVQGMPLLRVVADKEQLCSGESVVLRQDLEHAEDVLWEVNEGTGWKMLGTGKAWEFRFPASGRYDFRYRLQQGPKTVVSENFSVTPSDCEVNGVNYSKQLIFQDDFGTLDLQNHPNGTHYKVWDYETNPARPVQVSKTTTTPFRWPMNTNWEGFPAMFLPSGPLTEGKYAVGAWLGMSTPSGFQWSSAIHGINPIPALSFDHSGKREGGVLLINQLPNSKGSVLYKKTLHNLCLPYSRKLFFECFITVNIPEEEGVDVLVKLTGGETPVVLRGTNCRVGGSCGTGGQWVRIAGEIPISGNQLDIEIINNLETFREYGNDLALDDIRVYALVNPSVRLSFGPPDFKMTASGCREEVFELYVSSQEELQRFYNRTPFYQVQYTDMPENPESWQNLRLPDNYYRPSISYEDLNHWGRNELYFRVIAADMGTFEDHNNFLPPHTAEPADPCRRYSVSAPVRITFDRDDCLVLGAKESHGENMTFYPNPALSTITLSGEAESFKVTDVTGNVLLQGTGNVIDIRELSKNLYFAYIRSSDGKEIWKKFIKE